jgi:hypothetical protein
MRLPTRPLAIALTIALGLGVWSVAVNYTPATTFADGNILTAAQLNGEFTAIQTAVASKVDLTGGNLTGRVNIDAAASSAGSGDPFAVLQVRNTADTGHAAVFRSQSGNTNEDPVVAIKGNGVGPALSVKNANSGGTLIAGSNTNEVRFVVEYDGSIRVGALGSDGNDTPSLRIDSATGTIRNAVGSGLPVAYGSISGAGAKQNAASTNNFTVDKTATGTYQITLPGFNFNQNSATTVVSPRSATAAYFATASSRLVGSETVLEVRTYNASGTLADVGFAFITFKPGS